MVKVRRHYDVKKGCSDLSYTVIIHGLNGLCKKPLIMSNYQYENCLLFQTRNLVNMAKLLRNVQRAMKRGALFRGGITGSVISLSTVTILQESDLRKPTSSLNLDNIKEKWSHKFLLQQSRFI